MAKIVGMNGGQQPPQQPKIDLKDAKKMTYKNVVVQYLYQVTNS